MKKRLAGLLAGATLVFAQASQAALSLLETYQPGAGGLVGVAFDNKKGHTWYYPASGSEIRGFRGATALTPLVRPGEAANDADVEIAPEALVLGSTTVPAGTLLFINGETGVAEIYAIDPATGGVLATLTTGFGASHVVGGAYHPRRDTFFLVQDRVPGGSLASLVAEVDAQTGAVLNSFQIASVFTVNYGDLDIHKGTGNLYVASSDEPRVAEFTPTGQFVRYWPLPDGVSAVSGIAIDDKRNEAWMSGVGGAVWRLGNVIAD